MRYVQGMLLGFLLLIVSPTAWAGSLDSTAAPTSPDSGMYTLTDIFNRLNTGAAGSKRGGAFVEPGAGPTAGTGKTLDEVMDKAPVVDNAHGAGVANVQAGKTFWGLTSGEWGIRTGTLDPDAIPCTGTRWSNEAADPNGRWCYNPNGTVTDLFGATINEKLKGKGLVWHRNAGGWGSGRESRNWIDAHTYASLLPNNEALSDGSVVGDWRLPTLEELKALTQGTHPIRFATPGPFVNVPQNPGSYCWSSTSNPLDGNTAKGVDVDYGDVNNLSKGTTYTVWPVRAKQ